MKPEALIREATVGDAEEWIRLRMAFLAEMRNASSGAVAAETVASANQAYFLEALPRGDYVAWAAFDGSAMVAASGLTLFRRPPTARNPAGLEGYIGNMYTVPAWRGRGIASALIRRIIDTAKERRAGRLWLTATSDGRGVYEKAGFAAAERSSPNEEMELKL